MVRSFSWPGLIDCKLIILIVNYGKFAAEYRLKQALLGILFQQQYALNPQIWDWKFLKTPVPLIWALPFER